MVSQSTSIFAIPILIGVMILVVSIAVYQQLNEYEHEIVESNKERIERNIENVITRREGRIQTISASIIAFYSSSEFVSSEEFYNFAKIVLGSNSEVLNLFVLEGDRIIHSHPIHAYVGSDFDETFPTYPTEIDGTKAMTAVFAIDSDLSLVVAIPFDYFVQSDAIVSNNYKLVLLSPVDNNVRLYEIEKKQDTVNHHVSFTDREKENTIRIEKQTGLFGYKIQKHYDLEYVFWDDSFEQQSTLPLLLLIPSVALSVIIPILLIRTNVLKDQLLEKSESLQKANLDLVNAERSKDEFVTMIVHDLKNPLVPMQAYVDILLTQKLGSLNDAQKDRLNSIKTSILTLQKMIHDLLDANKMELGKLTLEFQKYDLAEIIRNSIEKLEHEIRKKGVEISTSLQSGVICECDRIRIEQVLTNLLLNAIDFVPENSGRIEVILTSDTTTASITVKDNGIGIPKDKIDNLFVKFYQINSNRDRKYGGSGLGLSVCRGIVEGHRGKIWAESDGDGKGSVFFVNLPINHVG